jgi:hypothetical protein
MVLQLKSDNIDNCGILELWIDVDEWQWGEALPQRANVPSHDLGKRRDEPMVKIKEPWRECVLSKDGHFSSQTAPANLRRIAFFPCHGRKLVHRERA